MGGNSFTLFVSPHLRGGGGYRPDPASRGVLHIGNPPCWTWLGVPWQGGTPPQVSPSDLARGYPSRGYSTLGTLPLSDLAGGTLVGGTPPWVPPSDLARGYPPVGPGWGVLHLGYPPIRPGWGYPGGGIPPRVTPLGPGQGVPQPGGGYPTSYRITDGVLVTPRSVCLLRSRRRTVL